MNETKPITAFIFFRVPPALEQSWDEVWTEVKGEADNIPACRLFHLLRDPSDGSARVVLTEWDSATEWATFVREAGLLWCERATTSAAIIPKHTIFEAIQMEGKPAHGDESRTLVTVA